MSDIYILQGAIHLDILPLSQAEVSSKAFKQGNSKVKAAAQSIVLPLQRLDSQKPVKGSSRLTSESSIPRRKRNNSV